MIRRGRRLAGTVSLNKPTLRERLGHWLLGNRDDVDVVETFSGDGLLHSEPFRFSIYRANGGTVVETRSWNSKNDQNDTRLHIITDDNDLGQSLAKIITMETLRG
jgi:hypothetical protein